MARSLKNDKVVPFDFVKKNIKAHLPRRKDFSFKELQQFLERIGIRTIPIEVSHVVQIIIEEGYEPTDNLNKPVLNVRGDEFVFRLGHL